MYHIHFHQIILCIYPVFTYCDWLGNPGYATGFRFEPGATRLLAEKPPLKQSAQIRWITEQFDKDQRSSATRRGIALRLERVAVSPEHWPTFETTE
jgi:hypothetical protein